MQLEITSVSKDPYGVYDIAVRINNSKIYVYVITSEYDYDKIMAHYRAGRFGQCLTALNAWKKIL